MMIHKNPKWLTFLIVVASVVFWFTGKAIYFSYVDAQLKNQVPTNTVHWSTKTLSEEQYQIQADYTFSINNETYIGKTVFEKPFYRNPYAAQKIIQTLTQQQWKTWYNPKKPTHSSLEKNFPLKDWIYAGILWGLLFYFIWLGQSIHTTYRK